MRPEPVPPERVVVVSPDDMDDVTFLKHIDARHGHEVKTERALHKHPHIQAAWVSTYRAWHEYTHRTSEADAYDHEHD